MPTAELILVRHGETEWSREKRHTSFTDLPLTDEGRARATDLRGALRDQSFSLVLSSPRQRATDTAHLALPGVAIETTEDLAEWDYGEYEGLTTEEVHESRDGGWDLWLDGCPGGESPRQVAARVDRVIERAQSVEGTVACFAHGHVLRVLAARWLGLKPDAGAFFYLDTASFSSLGSENARHVLLRWNVL